MSRVNKALHFIICLYLPEPYQQEYTVLTERPHFPQNNIGTHWLAGTDEANEGTWISQYTGQPLRYLGWGSGVNFINIKRARFSYECHFSSFFLRTYIRRKKLPK